LGLAGLALRLDCDGGVDPDENFELRLDIHEFRRPMGLGSVFREAGDVVDGFDSSLLSIGGGCVSIGAGSFLGTCFGSVAGGGVGRAGLLLERDLRCDFDWEVAGSASVPGLSLDDTDLVRDK
jgi:hypothetical protein